MQFQEIDFDNPPDGTTVTKNEDGSVTIEEKGYRFTAESLRKFQPKFINCETGERVFLQGEQQ